MKCFLKCSADGHGFTHGFHGRGEYVVGFGKFFKRPARNFHHTVINGRFKTGHGFAGDIIGDLIQGVPDCKLGCNFGNGKARGLGGKGRRPGHPGVHLNHDNIPVFRVHGKLNIGAARVHADFPDDGNGGIPQGLVFFVRQGLGRGHGNGITRVNPHGINVFNGADDYHVVRMVPHYLKLIFLPSQNRFLKHHLGDQGGVKAGLGKIGKLFHVVGHTTAGSP